MKEAYISIPGRPRGKERPRVCYNRTFTPRKTSDYEDQIRWCYKTSVKAGYMFTGAIEVEICAVFKPPKATSKKKAKTLIGTPFLHAPDADNITKIVLDALNKIAWEDDRQVYKISVSKIYGNVDALFVSIKETIIERSETFSTMISKEEEENEDYT